MREISLAEVQSFLSRGAPPVAAAAPAGATAPAVPGATLEAAAERIAGELNAEEVEAVLRDSVGGSVPSQLDRRLLVAGTQALGGVQLSSDQKRRVRAAFLSACRKLTG